MDVGAGGEAVLLADADRRFRRTAGRALAAAGFRIREASSGREALATAADGIALAVLDVRLDDPSGYEVCLRLREEHGEALPIMFVSRDRTEAFDRVAGLLLGADDYLVKPIAPDELVARVRRHLRRVATWNGRGIRLTKREREVLELLANGLSPAQIAGLLGISPKTVGTHVEHIYAKLGVHTRAQAVASAFRLSLISGR